VYLLEDNPAKFYSDPIRNDGSKCFSEQCLKNNNNNNKMGSDIGSVPVPNIQFLVHTAAHITVGKSTVRVEKFPKITYIKLKRMFPHLKAIRRPLVRRVFFWTSKQIYPDVIHAHLSRTIDQQHMWF